MTSLANQEEARISQCLRQRFPVKPKKKLRPPGRVSIAGGSRAASLYQSVLEAVVEHRLPPGAKLTEEQLGAVFGVSRTIVRSALQALAHDHIVTIARNRGAFVSAPTRRRRA